MHSNLLDFEFIILDLFSKIRCEFLDDVMIFSSSLANKGFIWILLAITLLFFKKTRRIGVCVSVALIVNFLLVNVIIKPIVARPRPYEVNTALKILIPPPKDFSFPSGHTSASFSASLALYMHNRRWGIACIVLAVLISASRLYLCVHFPSDVIFGIFFGVISAYISSYICKKHLYKNGR